MRKLLAGIAFLGALFMTQAAPAATHSDLSITQAVPAAEMHDYVTFTSTVVNNGPTTAGNANARWVTAKGLDVINQDCGAASTANPPSCEWGGTYPVGSKLTMKITAQVVSVPAYLKVCAFSLNPSQIDSNSANDCTTTRVDILPSVFITDTSNDSSPPLVNILVYNFRVPASSSSVAANGPYGVVHITCFSNGVKVQDIWHKQQTTVSHYDNPFTHLEYDSQGLRSIAAPQAPSYPCPSYLGYFSYSGRWHTVATFQFGVDATA